jgi:hypothetical protein
VKPRIPYTDLEVRYATDAAANGWGERCYANIERFENSFKVTRSMSAKRLPPKPILLNFNWPENPGGTGQSYSNSPRARPCRPADSQAAMFTHFLFKITYAPLQSG